MAFDWCPFLYPLIWSTFKIQGLKCCWDGSTCSYAPLILLASSYKSWGSIADCFKSHTNGVGAIEGVQKCVTVYCNCSNQRIWNRQEAGFWFGCSGNANTRAGYTVPTPLYLCAFSVTWTQVKRKAGQYRQYVNVHEYCDFSSDCKCGRSYSGLRGNHWKAMESFCEKRNADSK